MPKTYLVTDRRTTLVVARLPKILGLVRLTDVVTVEDSNVITATIAGEGKVYPGMMVACKGIPFGAEVKAVNGDEIILQASVWDPVTQMFTLSEAGANATASATELAATAHGYNPVRRVGWVPKGVWRNIFRAHSYIESDGGVITNPNALWTMFTEYERVEGTPNTFPTDTIQTRISDELMEVPALRHRMEPWGVWVFVDEDGFEMTVPYDPQNLIVSIEPEEEA